MRDEHLTPVLTACSEAELALLIEFLGRPPSGLLWLDRRIWAPGASREQRVAAVVEELLRCGDHSVTGRVSPSKPGYLQVVCDALHELGLSEAPKGGVLGLEMRVVRYVLDSEFERLDAKVQASLLASFYAGEFFAGGLRGYDALHPFMTHTDAEHRVPETGKIARTVTRIGRQQLRKRIRFFITKRALRLLLRGLARPVLWAMTAWDLLGPAYRLTVPAICYVAYLRHGQQLRAEAEVQARAAS